MSAEHPILARFAQLQDQWRSFLEDAHARLLVWRAEPDELQLVQGFLAGDAEAAEAGLFAPQVRLLTSAFDAADRHGATLVRALHDDGKGAQVPSACHHDDDVAALCGALEAMRVQVTPSGRESPLSVWLAPARIADAAAYRGWLARLVRAAPAALRIVVVERIGATDHGLLQVEHPLRVRVQACELDMPEALCGLARRADDGGEGSRYRLLLLQLSEAIRGGDGQLANQVARSATELALNAHWPSLAVGAQMMLAVGYGQLGDGMSALRAYVDAEQLAVAAERAEHAADVAASERCGARLRLSARLGQAAQLLAEQAYDKAAAHYASCARLAVQLPDPRLALDGHRLAASCFALVGAHREAWRHGLAGLAVAEAMDAETRATSTLPFLAGQLLRMHAGAVYGAPDGALEDRLTALLGSGWRGQIPS